MSEADECVALRNLKTSWKGLAPENGDYGEAFAALNSSQMVGEVLGLPLASRTS
jgi:hypothetical protein